MQKKIEVDNAIKATQLIWAKAQIWPDNLILRVFMTVRDFSCQREDSFSKKQFKRIIIVQGEEAFQNLWL